MADVKNNTEDKMEAKMIEGIEKLTREISELKSTINNKSSKVFNKIKDQAEEYQEEAVEYLKNNPYKSLLIALGVGAVIACLICRRK